MPPAAVPRKAALPVGAAAVHVVRPAAGHGITPFPSSLQAGGGTRSRAGSSEMFGFFLSYSWGDRTRAFLTRQAQAWSHSARHPGECSKPSVRTGRKGWAMTEQHRGPVASYKMYREAARAVDHLSDHGFPVERAAIIGQGLRLVEQVIGRMDYGRAALHGAASGALPGLLIGWLFGLVNWLDPVVSALLLALYGLVFGAIIGALSGCCCTPCRAVAGISPRSARCSRAVRGRRGRGGLRRGCRADRRAADHRRRSHPYLNERGPESRRRRRTGRSSSWPRQWASTWAPPTR
ncbi:general stress protein [Streptomyces sp. NBC_00996]|uniref:general stress protein n=1 Tax=Streptomyces sp. NBC_00996 TaxID=2903710 RepID=UPI00386E41A1